MTTLFGKDWTVGPLGPWRMTLTAKWTKKTIVEHKLGYDIVGSGYQVRRFKRAEDAIRFVIANPK